MSSPLSSCMNICNVHFTVSLEPYVTLISEQLSVVYDDVHILEFQLCLSVVQLYQQVLHSMSDYKIDCVVLLYQQALHFIFYYKIDCALSTPRTS